MKSSVKVVVGRLRENDRVRFSPNTFAVHHNSEIDISYMSGVVVRNDTKDDCCIWIRMDSYIKDLDYWHNQIQFGEGGTPLCDLKQATLILEGD
jgi:hypothetical protein